MFNKKKTNLSTVGIHLPFIQNLKENGIDI